MATSPLPAVRSVAPRPAERTWVDSPFPFQNLGCVVTDQRFDAVLHQLTPHAAGLVPREHADTDVATGTGSHLAFPGVASAEEVYHLVALLEGILENVPKQDGAGGEVFETRAVCSTQRTEHVVMEHGVDVGDGRTIEEEQVQNRDGGSGNGSVREEVVM